MAILALRKHEGATWEPGVITGKGSTTDRCMSRACNLERAGRASVIGRDGRPQRCYFCWRCGEMWCRTNSLDFLTGLTLKEAAATEPEKEEDDGGIES